MAAKRKRDLYIAINELDMVKVGISANVERRIRDIANASGLAVRLLAKAPLTKLTSVGAEQYIFAKFEKYRAVGEWFSMDLLVDYDIEEIIAFKSEVYDLWRIKEALHKSPHRLEDMFANFRVHRFLSLSKNLEYIADDMERRIRRKPANLGQYTQMTYMVGAYDCIRLVLEKGWGISLEPFDSREETNRKIIRDFDKRLDEIREDEMIVESHSTAFKPR